MNISKQIKTILSIVGSLGCFASISAASDESSTNLNQPVVSTVDKYEIYPTPHQITYNEKSYIMTPSINVVIEEGIDQATINRFKETLNLRNITYTTSRRIVKNKTNILIGTKDNRDNFVDDYVKEKNIEYQEGLLDKTDSYLLDNQDNVITLYAKENDAAFYGLTSLYHIFKQLRGLKISEFKIQDYADVKSRGVIEGYYGNPWSVQDRINYMKWGSYFKLNGYFYAPKDDPKHIDRWRELYTVEEIENKIKPIAVAGNETKVRYIYTLHPFKSNIITDANYDQSLIALKAKFKQVIDVGVRQIGILADDFHSPSQALEKKLLEDVVAWLKELKANEYPDMKTTLPFVVHDYGGWGSERFKALPQEVQIVMTGGKIWGEVSVNFTNSFTNTSGRGPFLWINWPCSDNSKNHLIMGGYKEFLHKNVNPNNLEGIILNPMQQSEPSKVAIFGNAEYSWNIWDNDNHIDKVYHDAFKYVENNSIVETPESTALRELSKHMINQKMDSRVVKLEESVEIRDTLSEFNRALQTETYTDEQINNLIDVFSKLHDHATTLLESGHDRNLISQMEPFLGSWVDLTNSIVNFLNALKQYKLGNISGFLELVTTAKKDLTLARTNHKFRYLSEFKDPEVGNQHIQPFVNNLNAYASGLQKSSLDPNFITKTYISDVYLSPAGGTKEKIFEPGNRENVYFKNPNIVRNGNYIGVKYNKPITLQNVYIEMNAGKNHFFRSKLQYTTNGTDWVDVSSEVYDRPLNSVVPVEVNNLNISNVLGVRLISTQDDPNDSWFGLTQFIVNKPVVEESQAKASWLPIVNVTLPVKFATAGGNKDRVLDDDNATEWWLKSVDGDLSSENSELHIGLGTIQEVTKVKIFQGGTNSGDVLEDVEVQYFDTTDNTWKQFGDRHFDSSKDQTIYGYCHTNKLRLVNRKEKRVWWRLGTIKVGGYDASATFNKTAIAYNTQIGVNPSINDGARNNRYDYIVDGNKSTYAWISHKTSNGNIAANDGVEVIFDKTLELKTITVTQDTNDKLSAMVLEKEINGVWTTLGEIDNANQVWTFEVPANTGMVHGIRLKSKNGVSTWWKIKEIEFEEKRRPSAKYLLSNLESPQLLTDHQDDTFTLMNNTTTNTHSLKSGEYIGLDLKTLYRIKNVEVDYTQTEHIVLQASQNGHIWENINDVSELNNRTFKYLRLFNNNETSVTEPITVTFNSIKVHIKEQSSFGKLISSDMPINSTWGDTRFNGAAFDGNINTQTKFGGNPNTGNTAIYDIGTEIDLNSLRLYVSDNVQDYPRDLKVEYSTDQSNWQPAFTIGDSTQDSDRESNLQQLGAGLSDSRYPNIKYYGNDELNGVKARYIRLKVLANYPTRALIINEIVINNGEYISLANDPKFDGAVEVSRNYLPGKMIDGDFNSAYKPKNTNGSITYTLDESFNNKDLKIITSDEPSSATVSAVVVNDQGNKETLDLGTLDLSTSTFRLPSDKYLVSITITWTNIKPTINELIFFDRSQLTETSKEELQNNLITPSNFDQWTQIDKDKFNQAIELAKKVIASNAIAQETVNIMLNKIKFIVSNAKLKADTSGLKAKLASALTNANSFTTATWNNYMNAIKKVTKALENEDALSDVEVSKLTNLLNTTEEALEYSPTYKDIALLKVDEFTKLDRNLYDDESYMALSNIINEIKTKLDQDTLATNRAAKVTPEQYQALIEQYNNSLASAKESAKGLKYKEYSTLRDQVYSFIDNNGAKWQQLNKDLKAKIAAIDLKAEATNATIDSIVAATNELKTEFYAAKSAKKAELNKLKDLVNHPYSNDSNIYTSETFETYTNVLNKMTTLLTNEDQIRDDEISGYITELTNAINGLTLDSSKLEEAKALANNNLDQLTNKANYASQITEATTVEAVLAINKQILAAIKEQNDATIAAKKAEVKAIIDQISDFAAKEGLELSLFDADTLEAIETVKTNVLARLENDKTAKANVVKGQITAKIDQLNNPTKKAKLLEAMNNTNEIDALNTILDQVEAAIRNEKATAIVNKKQEATAILNSLNNKADFANKINQANSVEEVENIIQELQVALLAEQEQKLQELITQATELATKTDTPELYLNKLKSITTIEEARLLIETINQKIASLEHLKQMKAQRINNLKNKLLNLIQPYNQLSSYANEINQSNDETNLMALESQITSLINQIQQQALTNAKASALDQLTGLEDSQSFKQAINDATTVEQITNIIASINATKVEQLNKYKDQLLEKLKELENTELIDAYSKEIQAISTYDQIQPIKQKINQAIIEQQNHKLETATLNNQLAKYKTNYYNHLVKDDELKNQISNLLAINANNTNDLNDQTAKLTKLNQTLVDHLNTIGYEDYDKEINPSNDKEELKQELSKVKESLDNIKSKYSLSDEQITRINHLIQEISNLNYDNLSTNDLNNKLVEYKVANSEMNYLNHKVALVSRINENVEQLKTIRSKLANDNDLAKQIDTLLNNDYSNLNNNELQNKEGAISSLIETANNTISNQLESPKPSDPSAPEDKDETQQNKKVKNGPLSKIKITLISISTILATSILSFAGYKLFKRKKK
ncbi:beta-N-acetylglucosaminidase [Mycoplasma sp. NEAQ87857]|uniref:beta-N-acetylglucosaminidase domain-containing protein n=1 Tax=Mycoplasma sp. NEAQ87857 TaxID=2683967 RepID=UPI0013196003|nr:beta-N-acetylglucosaminidase domain-containing protein [Mycoplasma sp. NEAQ87857]QGZ97578.1 beta-N-acetylglucosaminidase [Mycoplasma sp. NEAQ87857]